MTTLSERQGYTKVGAKVGVIPCTCLAASVHFFTLSSIAWMGVEGVIMYLLIVKVFHTHISMFMWKASLFAWGKCYYFLSVLSEYVYINLVCLQKSLYTLRNKICLVNYRSSYTCVLKLAPLLIKVQVCSLNINVRTYESTLAQFSTIRGATIIQVQLCTLMSAANQACKRAVQRIQHLAQCSTFHGPVQTRLFCASLHSVWSVWSNMSALLNVTCPLFVYPYVFCSCVFQVFQHLLLHRPQY